MHAKVGHVCPLLGGCLVAETCCNLVLLRGQIGELVLAECELLTLGVLGRNGSHVGLEGLPVCCIFITVVHLAILGLVGLVGI